MPSLTVPVYRGFPVYTLASDRDVEVSTLLIPFADLYCYTLVLVRALQVNWGLGLAGKRAAAEHQCIPLVGYPNPGASNFEEFTTQPWFVEGVSTSFGREDALVAGDCQLPDIPVTVTGESGFPLFEPSLAANFSCVCQWAFPEIRFVAVSSRVFIADGNKITIVREPMQFLPAYFESCLAFPEKGEVTLALTRLLLSLSLRGGLSAEHINDILPHLKHIFAKAGSPADIRSGSTVMLQVRSVRGIWFPLVYFSLLFMCENSPLFQTQVTVLAILHSLLDASIHEAVVNSGEQSARSSRVTSPQAATGQCECVQFCIYILTRLRL